MVGNPPPRLSLVVPLFDEEDNVQPLLAECFGVLQGMRIPFEVVAVNDGSRDRTLERLLAARADFPGLRVVSLRRNSGQSAAMVAGFKAARGELIATVDGDLQNDPADIPRLLERIEMGECDMVSGW